MIQTPTLETERLLLRVPIHEDFERYAEFFCSEAAAPIGGPLSRGVAWRRFLQMPGAWMVQGFAMFSVIEKERGVWIGQAGPWYPDGWPGREVGYSFHQDAQGKGYATEAVVACMDYVFDVLGWDEVCHTIKSDNMPSKAVAKRVGSDYLGKVELMPPWDHLDAESWGQTKAQWHQHRTSLTSGKPST